MHFGNLRIIKILLSFSVAAWGIIAGAMNLLYYQPGTQAVSRVLAMGGEESIRSLSSPVFVHVGYAFIYISKFAVGVICAWGTYQMWIAYKGSAEQFSQAKSSALTGCGIALFMLFFGFIVLAGSFFSTGSPSQAKLIYHHFTIIYMAGIGLIAFFIALPESSV